MNRALSKAKVTTCVCLSNFYSYSLPEKKTNQPTKIPLTKAFLQKVHFSFQKICWVKILRFVLCLIKLNGFDCGEEKKKSHKWHIKKNRMSVACKRTFLYSIWKRNTGHLGLWRFETSDENAGAVLLLFWMSFPVVKIE